METRLTVPGPYSGHIQTHQSHSQSTISYIAELPNPLKSTGTDRYPALTGGLLPSKPWFMVAQAEISESQSTEEHQPSGEPGSFYIKLIRTNERAEDHQPHYADPIASSERSDPVLRPPASRLSPPHALLMSSMNQRFKNLVGSRRKTSNSNSVTTANSNGSLTSLPTNGAAINTASTDSNRASSIASTQPTTPPPTGSSIGRGPSPHHTAMPSNGQPTQATLGRPPSYQYAHAQGGVAMPNRTGAPLSPPPSTQAAPYSQPGMPQYPQHTNGSYYAPQSVQSPQGGSMYGRVDSDRQNRSKAQLIVGIDFVSHL